MGFTENSVVSSASWPLVTVMVVALWILALLEIKNRRGDVSFTNMVRTSMTVAVSVAAVTTIMLVSVVLPPPWDKAAQFGTTSTTTTCEDPIQSYVFSFGLEYAVCSCDSTCENNEGGVKNR